MLDWVVMRNSLVLAVIWVVALLGLVELHEPSGRMVQQQRMDQLQISQASAVWLLKKYR